MKPSYLPTAALLLGAPLLPVPARAADKPGPTAIPAPEWVQMIDQGDLDPRLKGYKTPEGVKVEIVAEDGLDGLLQSTAFDDEGTLYVLQVMLRPDPKAAVATKDRVYRYKDGSERLGYRWSRLNRSVVKALTDSKGKGVYDHAEAVFEDDDISDFSFRDNWLYVCGQGTVRRYRRSKEKGAYDVKEVVAQGFLGDDVCGLAFGPDGRLYITAGDGDNVVEGSDGSRATVLGSGAIFRCRPDGSQMETFAIGFCSPVASVTFDAAGNLFRQDGGHHPAQGGRFAGCRLLHVVEGANFGWRCSPIQPEYADPLRATIDGGRPGTLPPMRTAAAGFSTGMLVYNETRLPENYRGLIFATEHLITDHGQAAIHAYKVERKGATVTATQQFDLLTAEKRPFDPAEPVVGPDGAVYVVDRLDFLHGRIYRLTWAGTKDQPALPPRGMDSWAKIAKLGDDELVKTLSAEDGSDREHAARELARRGEKERPALLKLFKDADAPDPARITALGALESMWDAEAQAAALSALEHDSNPDVRRLTADAVGLNAAKGDGDVHAVLLRALNDAAPEVRRSAALAMSRVAADGAPDNLVNTWAFDDGHDAYPSDGLVRAIENLGKPGVERLIALGESGSKKELDKAVQAFTMMRTRPAADALPRMLENPHLATPQRAALVRSYENYLLDPPVSLAPLVQYLIDHPAEDPSVKLAGAEALAAGGAAPGDKAAGWALGLLDEKDGKLRVAGANALAALDVGPEEARRVGQALADGALPPEARPAVVRVLGRCADKDAECARLLKQVGKP